jgi:4-aminobutyrate aminotransferase/(S)-3-amino-2-methylpropionate transaminase
MEHFGILPDLTVMSKSLAAWIPLNAVTGRAEIMDAPEKKKSAAHWREARLVA